MWCAMEFSILFHCAIKIARVALKQYHSIIIHSIQPDAFNVAISMQKCLLQFTIQLLCKSACFLLLLLLGAKVSNEHNLLLLLLLMLLSICVNASDFYYSNLLCPLKMSN